MEQKDFEALLNEHYPHLVEIQKFIQKAIEDSPGGYGDFEIKGSFRARIVNKMQMLQSGTWLRDKR
jgi:hypothetical protein